MENTVDKNEETLFLVHVLLALVFWTFLIVVTQGWVLLPVAALFLPYLFAQSGLISYLRGTGAIVSARQFPDLHKIHQECCRKLNVSPEPELILIHADGIFNALAARFLNRHYVVLYSDVVDALADNKDAIAFYIGHELGHIRRNHLLWRPLLAPAMLIPLLAPAYQRTQEYTCDLHGLYCCASPDAAVKAMSALAVGARRWMDMDAAAYVAQGELTRGFWMSYHEYVGSYPWLVKRIMRARAGGRADVLPRRNVFAAVLALLDLRLFFLVCFVFAALNADRKISSVIYDVRHPSPKVLIDPETGERLNPDGLPYEEDAGEEEEEEE